MGHGRLNRLKKRLELGRDALMREMVDQFPAGSVVYVQVNANQTRLTSGTVMEFRDWYPSGHVRVRLNTPKQLVRDFQFDRVFFGKTPQE